MRPAGSPLPPRVAELLRAVLAHHGGRWQISVADIIEMERAAGFPPSRAVRQVAEIARWFDEAGHVDGVRSRVVLVFELVDDDAEPEATP